MPRSDLWPDASGSHPFHGKCNVGRITIFVDGNERYRFIPLDVKTPGTFWSDEDSFTDLEFKPTCGIGFHDGNYPKPGCTVFTFHHPSVIVIISSLICNRHHFIRSTKTESPISQQTLFALPSATRTKSDVRPYCTVFTLLRRMDARFRGQT